MNSTADKHCPLCGNPNHCTLAESPSKQQTRETPCWCYNIDIPEALREKIPVAQQMKACICTNCIKQSSP